MDQQSEYLKKIGARILSEANDLKRTKEALANELGFGQNLIDAVINGEARRETVDCVVKAMVDSYPIPLSDIWIEQDDTDFGVRVITSKDSAASSRTFERRNASGGHSPYYEYRDTAMSRTAPFKPEWIKELRVVSDSDPDNNDVAYNNGHLMHQATFFIGPVNFYWDINNTRHCVEMDTGDSNYITPFVPHSFTSRDPDNLGLIVAVTYGGDVHRALSDFSYVDSEAIEALAADPRQPDLAFVRLINRLASTESISTTQLIERLVEAGFTPDRAHQIITFGGADIEEIVTIAIAMNVSPKDLSVSHMVNGAEVVIGHRQGARKHYYPNEGDPAYEFTELARTLHQPLLKGLDVAVLGGTPADLQHPLHEYAYNYGPTPVRLTWEDNHTAVLDSGDSAYVRPMVSHRFELSEGCDRGDLVLIRIPGGIDNQSMTEFSTYAPEGRARVVKESRAWF